MEPAGSGATWTGSPKGVFAGRKHHKPRLSLDNNTAGVCDRSEWSGGPSDIEGKTTRVGASECGQRTSFNCTRVAGHLDEIQGVVADTLQLHRNEAVGFIDWLDGLRGNRSAPEDMMVNVQICQHRCRGQTDRENTVAGWRTLTAVCVPCPRCAHQAAAERGEQERMDEK